jgi:hypothetical protein
VGLIFFESYYENQLWDSQTAALVNGRSISRFSVEEIMEIGLNPPLSLESKAPGTLSIGQILNRLIDEELISQAAAQEGILISDKMLDDYLLDFQKAWGCENPDSPICQAPKGQEMEAFVRALRQQLLLKKITSHIVTNRSQRSSDDWKIFWENWRLRYSFASIYKVKVLLAQKTEEGKKTINSLIKAKKNTLDEVALKLREKGLAILVSQPLSMHPLDPNMRPFFEIKNLSLILSEALKSPNHLSSLEELVGSLVVFEVLEVSPAISPQDLVKAARSAYEQRVGDIAFRDWLQELRAKADIKINPNFLGEEEAQKLLGGKTETQFDKWRKNLVNFFQFKTNQ